MMRIVTVSELNRYIRDILEGNTVLANVWVKGEITNLKYHPSGHLYFSLKDKQAALKVVMFRSRASKLAFRLENGTAAVVRGYVGVYERDGQYQLYAEDVEPEGLGALYLALEQLKQQLEREGLFDSRRKRALPPVPSRVALVTSAVGAAVKDMLIVLRRRWPMAAVVIVPVAVQGEAAPDQIAAALYQLSRTGAADVVIVGRGGGSPEELWAFNSELVARAVADSRIPVVSAVGHEKDVTIADLVADRRAPTPSAAAELVVPDQSDVRRHLAVLRLRLGRGLDQQLRGYRERIERVQSRKGLADPQDWLCQRRKDTVDGFERRLVNSMRGAFDRGAARLSTLVARLEAVSPMNTLARGYSICRLAGAEKAVLDVAEVQTGAKVHVQLLRGQLSCTVNYKSETGAGTGGGSS